MEIHAEGFVYVATGERYRQEAAISAASLRAASPGARICLLTDRADGPPFWDDLVIIERPMFSFRDKIAMWRCPYARFVFLDTDTYVTWDLNDLFVMLRRFDVIGHQLFEGHDVGLPGIPDAFPEFNSGVLGFARSPAVEEFFRRWERTFTKYFELNDGANYHYSNVSDQKSFRQSVWEAGLSIGVLGPEYNFVPHHLNFACAPVRIIHTRSEPDRLALASRINRRLGNRVYVPSLDVVLSNDTQGAELRRLWLGATLQLLRAAGRSLVPRFVRDRLRGTQVIRRLFLHNRFMRDDPRDAAKWRRSQNSDSKP